MANPRDNIIEQGGLETHPNDLASQNPRMSVARNVIINRDGMLERRRGFKDNSNNIPAFLPQQLLVSSDASQSYMHLDNGLWYYDSASGNWYRKSGLLGQSLGGPSYGTTIGNNLFITSSSHVVFSIDLTTGSRTVIAGRYGVTGSVDGTGDAARFNFPGGITSNGVDTLYVADTSNFAIRTININTKVVGTVAGTMGSSGYTDATGAAARFNAPLGIAYDGSSLFVCENTSHTIRRVAPPLTAGNGVVTTIAGTAGASGTADGTGAAARFNRPSDLTYMGNTLYVVSVGGHTVRSVAPPLTVGAAVVTTLAGLANNSGNAIGTGTTARFNQPTGISNDGTSLYVADSGNLIVRKVVGPYTLNAATSSTLAGVAGSVTDIDGIGTAASFSAMTGVFYSAQTLYVASASLRKMYLLNNYVSTIDGIPGYSSYPSSPGLPNAGGIVIGPT